VKPDNNKYGISNGSDWNNAFSGLPSDGKEKGTIWGGKSNLKAVKPGDTIYIAGGIYTKTWEPFAEGLSTAPITIKRATKDDHGTNKGWDDSFDSQVILKGTSIILWNCNNLILDGSKENGIKIQLFSGRTKEEASNHAYGILLSPYNNYPSNNIIIRNIEIEGTIDGKKREEDITNSMIGIKCTPIKNLSANNILIENCYIHHLVSTGLQLQNTNGLTLQNSKLGYFNDVWCEKYPNCWHESFIITTDSSNLIFRNNTFYNSGSDGISIREGNTNCYIYSNIFYTTPDFNNGRSGKGVNTTKPNSAHKSIWNENKNIIINNNTFVNMTFGLSIDSSVVNAEIYNNIFYNCENNIIEINNHDYNWFSGFKKYSELHGISGGIENPFHDLINLNLNLKKGSTPIDSGKEMNKLYNIDKNLHLRPAGNAWDIGAYEFINKLLYPE
jgi:hypothetical protein